ncbi:MAG: FtsW/RodA/SpoVE family cell cycle protein, partial [Cyanobacteria bacterium J06648_11]
MICSASMSVARADIGDGFYFVKRQLAFILLGYGCFAAIVRWPLRRWVRFAGGLYVIGLLLVLATHVPGIGVTRLDATRWLNVGIIIVQPSEFLKPLLLLQAAWLFGRWHAHSRWYRGIWLFLFSLGLAAILTQPNLGTTAVCGITLWLMAVVGGLPLFALGGTAALGVIAAAASISLKEYQMRRMMAFLNPWENHQGIAYQLVQSLLAIGSGGAWGVGYGLSQQKLSYLPIQYTDFIFAVFAEEFGAIGTLSFLGLLLVYALTAVRVARRSRDIVGRLIASGAACLLVGQALLNICV